VLDRALWGSGSITSTRQGHLRRPATAASAVAA
jgi:hypothetical protein